MEPNYIIRIPPVPKKNNSRIMKNRATGQRYIAPSERYEQYAQDAQWFLRPVPEKPIDYPINIKYLFYVPDNRRRDASNLIESIDDILQDVGIIADDCWNIVAGHDGTRVMIDAENPRTEIYITRMEVEKKMRKSDFHKGQEVWIWRSGEGIQPATVLSVGRKYITACRNGSGWPVRFEIANDFHAEDGYGDYSLYLTKEDYEKKVAREKKQSKAERLYNWGTGLFRRVSDEELDELLEIAGRYTNG